MDNELAKDVGPSMFCRSYVPGKVVQVEKNFRYFLMDSITNIYYETGRMFRNIRKTFMDWAVPTMTIDIN